MNGGATGTAGLLPVLVPGVNGAWDWDPDIAEIPWGGIRCLRRLPYATVIPITIVVGRLVRW